LSVLIKNGGQTEVSNLSLEVYLGEINRLEEGFLIITVHLQKFWVVREVEDDVSQLHISVDNTQFPNIFNSQDY
jgi:hypothetical protein